MPLGTNTLIDHYKDEPAIQYLLTRANGGNKTLSFQTKLDTRYVGTEDRSVGCNYYPTVYETAELHFMSNREFFETELAFTPCQEYTATIDGRVYTVESGRKQAAIFGEDTLRVSDSLGLYYFARDSQYQPRLSL